MALNKPKDASELLRLCEIWLKTQYPEFILQTIDYSGKKLCVFKSKLLNFVMLLNHIVTKNADDLFKTCVNYYLPVFENDSFLSGVMIFFIHDSWWIVLQKFIMELGIKSL